VPITEHRCGRSSTSPRRRYAATGSARAFSRTEKGMSSVRFLASPNRVLRHFSGRTYKAIRSASLTFLTSTLPDPRAGNAPLRDRPNRTAPVSSEDGPGPAIGISISRCRQWSFGPARLDRLERQRRIICRAMGLGRPRSGPRPSNSVTSRGADDRLFRANRSSQRAQGAAPSDSASYINA